MNFIMCHEPKEIDDLLNRAGPVFTIRLMDAHRSLQQGGCIAEQRERRIPETLYAAEINLAGQAAEEPAGLRRVRELTDRWRPSETDRNLRNWEWYYLVALCHQDRLTVQHSGATCVAWSPDGLRLASADGDGAVRIRDAAPGYRWTGELP